MPRHRVATRARICSTDFYTYVGGGFEGSAKIAKYSDEWSLSPPHRVGWLVRKASTRRYLSFNPVTEHVASEMRLILRSGTGKAGVLYRACLDLPRLAVRCLPPARSPARPLAPEWCGLAWPVPKPIRKPGTALLACSRLIRRIAYPSDVGGAERRSRQPPHTIVFAHSSARTGPGLCGNVCGSAACRGLKRSIGWTEECVGVRCAFGLHVYTLQRSATLSNRVQRVAAQYDTSQCRYICVAV